MVLLNEPQQGTRFVRLPWDRVIMDKKGNKKEYLNSLSAPV